MDIWQYFDGYAAVKLTSADISNSILRIRSNMLPIWDLKHVDVLTVEFRIRRRDLSRLIQICNLHGEELKCLREWGLHCRLKAILHRPVLAVGLMLLLLFSFWLPGRIFFLRVEGNVRVPERQILESAAESGIRFGVSRRAIRSEKVKNALLEAMPSLSWAGVNTYGCTAVITVREREHAAEENEQNVVSSIVASRDGVIRQMTVASGNGLCKVGQAVKAGQVLISGYTDCGLCIQAQEAKGEIYAETRRTLEAVAPAKMLYRRDIIATERKVSLIIGKKRINFSNNSGILGTDCAKIYEEKYVTLPGGFQLPIAIVIETVTTYELTTGELFDGSQLLTDIANSYLESLMCAGTILQADERCTAGDGILLLTGDYCCYEMIGVTRIEENLPNYVESD